MQITERIAHSTAAQDELYALVSSIPDSAYGDASRLPDWTAAHVVAHLVGNCEAQARQIEYARRGDRIAVYDGGQPSRDADIERRARLSPAELRDELTQQHERYAAAVDGLDEQSARARVEFRDGTVTDVVSGRWMECLVHAVDLGHPNFTCRSWDPTFARVLIDYLLERLPDDRTFRLVATDADLDITVGAGDDPIDIEGSIADIAGFLSDRGPELVAGVHLGPYPRGSVPR